jgi:hypothetical protein
VFFFPLAAVAVAINVRITSNKADAIDLFNNDFFIFSSSRLDLL